MLVGCCWSAFAAKWEENASVSLLEVELGAIFFTKWYSRLVSDLEAPNVPRCLLKIRIELHSNNHTKRWKELCTKELTRLEWMGLCNGGKKACIENVNWGKIETERLSEQVLDVTDVTNLWLRYKRWEKTISPGMKWFTIVETLVSKMEANNVTENMHFWGCFQVFSTLKNYLWLITR